MQKEIFWKGLKQLIWTIVALGLIVCLSISVIMVAAVRRYQGDPGGRTLIVLGCKVNGMTPSTMLSRRLDVAAEILLKDSSLHCIVSGGQGEDEGCTESSAMRQYLLNKGVADSQIIEENQATSTRENIELSRRLIDDRGLSRQVIICTDFYHQYRAQVYADRMGLDSVAASCKTDLGKLLYHWLREIPGVIKAFAGR